MKTTRRALFLFLVLALLSLVAALAPGDTAHTDEPLAEEQRHDDAHDAPDVCAALDEAHEVLLLLQPREHAHLDRKLGRAAQAPSSLENGISWGHDGPLATALRLLPRVLSSLNPLSLVSKISLANPLPRAPRISRATRQNAERLFALLDKAEQAGCTEALAMRAEVRMFPPHGVRQDLAETFRLYQEYVQSSSDAHAQFILGFFYATGLGGAPRDQAKATLYYTFAALQGYQPAQMAMGYRYWAGIGVKEDCNAALEYYESASTSAQKRFLAGPPGGQTLALTPARLSDQFGGIFGPHASWASTGLMAYRQSIKASAASARGETETELLEYYKYHSDRDSVMFTIRLGRIYYLGSIYPHGVNFLVGPGISSGAEEVGEVGQSFELAKSYFFKVARQLWPADYDKNDKPVRKRQLKKEQEDIIRDPAMIAASFLGRMYLRGEGVQTNYRKAFLWFRRAAELGDREAHNNLGIMYRDALGVKGDLEKAITSFKLAASADLPDAQINLGKIHLRRGETAQAAQYFELALRHGSRFEAYHLLAGLHAPSARAHVAEGGSPGLCGLCVGYYKHVAETGLWNHDYIGEADRAWARGEEDKALVGWWVAAEMGSEIAQNNVAFLLSRGASAKASEGIPADSALALWTRSAAQDNADAMVMVGDFYYNGGAEPNATDAAEPDYARAITYYQTAADKTSAMAFWNLGYMYEHGQGVPRDWHLAKRHYDLSLLASSDAYLPWLLSLTKLYLRSWWIDIRTGGEVPGLSLFEDEVEGQGMWEGIKALFVGAPVLYDDDAEDADYEDFSGAGWEGGGGDAGGGRDRQGDGGGGDEIDELDDMFESLVILALTGVIMLLFWVRGRWAAQAAQQQQA